MSGDAFHAAPKSAQTDLLAVIADLQAEECSRSPSPGNLRAADVIEVSSS